MESQRSSTASAIDVNPLARTASMRALHHSGVPILAAFTGSHEEYHSPRDTPDLINYKGLYDITRLMGLILAARLGNVEVWRGRLVRPKTRASSLNGKVKDYIYKDNGKDWALVARKLEEVVAVLPHRLDAAAELGNAYLRLGDGAKAIRAYRRPLQQKQTPIDAGFARAFREQIARVEVASDPKAVVPMRDPWLE